MRFVGPVDLDNIPTVELVLERLDAPPASPPLGRTYYDTTLGAAQVYGIAGWYTLAAPTSLPPSGAAGGDLGGSYPNPTVRALQGRAVAAAAPSPGQALIWGGASWAPDAYDYGNLANVPATFPPSSHVHNADAITSGTLALARLPVAASGASSSAQLVRADDSRLSDGRAPTGSAKGDLSGNYPDPVVVALQGRGVAATAPTIGQALVWGSSGWAPQQVGSVRSVALTAPDILAVAGSPITDSGTLALTLATQGANVVLAGPISGGAAAPSFRALDPLDIPSLDAAKIASGTLPLVRGGTGQTTAAAAFAALAPLTTRGDLIARGASAPSRLPIGTAGQYLRANGTDPIWTTIPWSDLILTPTTLAGYGITDAVSSTATQSANAILAGPTTGVAAAPTFRALVAADIPSLDAAKIGSGTFGVARGGTGLNSYTAGDILYASGAAALGALNAVASGNALISNGANTAPGWGKIGLATHVSGTLGLTNGGTGQTTAAAAYAALAPLTTRGDLITRGASAPARLAIGTAGQYLRSDGTDPSWSALLWADVTGRPTTLGGYGITDAVSSTATRSANQVLAGPTSGAAAAPTFRALDPLDIPSLDAAKIGSGTFGVARGGTGLSAYTAGDLLYASAANALSALADVATGNVLLSGGVGAAPAWGKVALATHVSGVLASANGGSGVATAAANTVLAGPTTGVAAAPSVRALVSADIPALDMAKITTGILPAAQGGTGTNNAGTLAVGANTTLSGGGTLALAGFTLTVPATGTAALVGRDNAFTVAQGVRAVASGNAAGLYVPWVSGDALPTLVAGASTGGNNQHAITAASDSGRGVSASSVSGSAIFGQITGSGYPLAGDRTAALTNVPAVIALLRHNTSGTPAANFGAALLLQLQSSTTASQDAAQINAAWLDATHASRTSYLAFSTVSAAGALSERLRVLAGTSVFYSSLQVGPTGASPVSNIEVGVNGTGNRYAHIDLVGDDTYTDYGLRVIRNNTGADTNSEIAHRGTGNLILNAYDAGYLRFQTSNALTMLINPAGATTANTLRLEGNQTPTAFTSGSTGLEMGMSGSLGFIQLGVRPTFAYGTGAISIAPSGGAVYIGKTTGYSGQGDLDVRGSVRIDGATASSNGRLMVQGTTWISHFALGSNEDTYIRSGKTGGFVTLNDNGIGNVYLVAGGGSVGVGTTSPSRQLAINATNSYLSWMVSGAEKWVAGAEGSNSNRWILYNTANGTYPIIVDANSYALFAKSVGINQSPAASVQLSIKGIDATANNGAIIAYDSGSTTLFQVRNDGVGYLKAASWSYGSDAALKEEITPLAYGLREVLAIPPDRFFYKGQPQPFLGFIAQKVRPHLPEVVGVSPDGLYTLATEGMIPVLWRALQQLADGADDGQSALWRVIRQLATDVAALKGA